MEIIPMRDLKDTVKIEKLCRETKSPVFITKNGYGSLVVMDIECFENMLREAYETKEIDKGIEDVKQGRVHKGDQVLKDLKSRYGF